MPKDNQVTIVTEREEEPRLCVCLHPIASHVQWNGERWGRTPCGVCKHAGRVCDRWVPLSIPLDRSCPKCIALRMLCELSDSGFEFSSRLGDQIEDLVRAPHLALCEHHREVTTCEESTIVDGWTAPGDGR